MFRNRCIPPIVLLLALLGLIAGRAEAQPRPSSVLLLPYFEVDVKGTGKTTLFAVGNSLDQPVDITIEIRTNWGIVIASIPERLEARQVLSFNLRDWVVSGKFPNRVLRTAEKDQLKAALAGQRTPIDNLFYSTPAAANLAVGSVVIRTDPFQPEHALFGDFLLVDGSSSVSMGDDLINIDPSASCPGSSLCDDHAIRFVAGKEINADTELVIWTDRTAEPSQNPYPESQRLALDGQVFNEDGQVISDVHLRLLPLQVVSVSSLGLREPFGWLEVASEKPAFIGVHFDTSKKDGAALQAFCLPSKLPPPPEPPGLTIEKRTNGQDADVAPGPTIPVGSEITWEYIVSNTGKVRLSHVTVTDDDASLQVICPKDVMDPGDVMVCTAHGTARACQYRNVGTVTASQPDGNGPDLTAEDVSHYFGGQNAKIDVELTINGQDADDPPGPTFQPGTPLQWSYLVTNTGDVNLTDVKVTDDRNGAVSCPKTSLHPGESMTCTATGTAVAPGQFRNVGSVTGAPPCGDAVKDSDPAQYQVDGPPELKIVKLTNGQHNTQAPGANIPVGSPITWSYLVTNSGKVTLNNVKVTDDKLGNISCPKSSLKAGESMTCTASGVATACQYTNTGTVTGTSTSGVTLSALDYGFYFGQTYPAITLKKFTNGQDADTAPGPNIPVGSPITWSYVVKNTGDVALSNVVVTDNKGVAVSCPKTSLQPGESMTCTGNGTATTGQYENIGSVTAQSPCGAVVQASDPSHYFGTGDPKIEIVKLTNDQHFTQAPGASLNVGSTVTWSYLVTNKGQLVLSNVKVTDDKVGNIACPKTTLQPGESMTCTASGTVAACQYTNKGTATAMSPSGQSVMDDDFSFYFGQIHPGIDIQKLTNGQDGPTLSQGDAIVWTYQVTNTGDVALTNVKVTDDKGVAVSCPKSSLQKGESMTCTGNGTAIAGNYHNVGTVTANAPCDQKVSDSDESWYTGKPKQGQGCTPGYWKNHTDSWPPTGFSPSQKVQSVFSQASGYPALGNASLLDALSFQGGSTIDGAAGNLLRAAVAGLLDSAHPGVNYPRTTASLISDVNAALASRNRDTILLLASLIDGDNNLGCPLN